jgi:NAD(P)-dependent dehydrogenase (short-subunit alcohol dehydrogenase family)
MNAESAMAERLNLEGKVAVITGAGGDVGGATAVLMAERGATVVAVDRRHRNLAALRDRMPPGARLLSLTADVSEEEEVAGYVRAAMDAFGRIDIFFNNAGIEGSRTGAWRLLTELSLNDFNEIIAVNTTGVFLGLKHVIPLMTAGGAIVNTSSINGLKGSRGQVAYVASKHAVTAMTVAAAKECAASNIRVNAVAPGGITGRMMRDYVEILLANTPPGPPIPHRPPPIEKWAEPREIAGLVLFLCSEDAVSITGVCYSIDGGLIAM